jgi:hypothetical protein
VLDGAQQAETELEDICDEVDVSPKGFFGDVVGTAFDLGIDIRGVFGGITMIPSLVVRYVARTPRSSEDVSQICRAIEFIDRMAQRQRQSREPRSSRAREH